MVSSSLQYPRKPVVRGTHARQVILHARGYVHQKIKQEFDNWYDEEVSKNLPFDFQAELVTSCESDVRLLKQGCLTFMRDFKEQADFNPFDQMTIASACNRFLRMHCMEENTIASEPLLGWRNRVNHSRASMEWLTWCERDLRCQAWLDLSQDEHDEHESMARAYRHAVADHHPLHRQRIQHARNDGDFQIPGTHHTVDGYDADTNTVYEFHACFWHGCRTCHPQRTMYTPSSWIALWKM